MKFTDISELNIMENLTTSIFIESVEHVYHNYKQMNATCL